MPAKVSGQAGTLESCDALVIVQLHAGNGENLLEIDGPSTISFGEDIRSTVLEALFSLGISDSLTRISERGAIDCTLRARVETAARRALAAAGGEER